MTAGSPVRARIIQNRNGATREHPEARRPQSGRRTEERSRTHSCRGAGEGLATDIPASRRYDASPPRSPPSWVPHGRGKSVRIRKEQGGSSRSSGRQPGRPRAVTNRAGSALDHGGHLRERVAWLHGFFPRQRRQGARRRLHRSGIRRHLLFNDRGFSYAAAGTSSPANGAASGAAVEVPTRRPRHRREGRGGEGRLPPPQGAGPYAFYGRRRRRGCHRGVGSEGDAVVTEGVAGEETWLSQGWPPWFETPITLWSEAATPRCVRVRATRLTQRSRTRYRGGARRRREIGC
jgi:hypothetical protein